MNNGNTSIGIGIVLAVLIVGAVFWQKTSSFTVPADMAPVVSNAVTTGASSTPAVASTSPALAGITRGEVALHSSRQSCWSIINGDVYDLTSWIPQHPGGEQGILRLCGIDGSEKYNGKHGDASKQAAILFGFKIGVAAQ